MAQRNFQVKQVGYPAGGTFLQVIRSETEWWQVPETITARVELDGYEVELVTGLDGTDSPEIIRMAIERAPNGPPLSDLVRGPWAKVLEAVVDRAATRWERDPTTGRSTSRLGGPGVRGAAPMVIRRGRRSAQQHEQMEREVEQVVALWDEAQTQPAPIVFLSQRLGLSRRTTQRRVEKAVERMNREGS